MIFRALSRLVFFALALAIAWVVRRLLGGLVGQGSARRSPAAAAPTEGRMVRDLVCDTFLPQDAALRERRDGREHFFCSERCRRTFLEGVEAGI